MWKYLAVQGLLFFLFFQPDLVSLRAARILLIMIALAAVEMTLLYAAMDPFVWLLYCFEIFLTYYMAQKALRWVSANRQKMREEVRSIEDNMKILSNEMEGKNSNIDTLQQEINHISHIYDKVKEMSRSLEFLDAFVDLSEVLMENFS